MADLGQVSVDTSEMPARRKKIVLRLQKKMEAIGKLNRGASLRDVAKEYGVGVSTACDWKYRQEKIFKFCSRILSQEGLSQRSTSKPAAFQTLDHELFNWYKKAVESQQYINGKILRKEAKRISFELTGANNFSASSSWLSRWKLRHGIFGKFFKRPTNGKPSKPRQVITFDFSEAKVRDETISISDSSDDEGESELLVDEATFTSGPRVFAEPNQVHSENLCDPFAGTKSPVLSSPDKPEVLEMKQKEKAEDKQAELSKSGDPNVQFQFSNKVCQAAQTDQDEDIDFLFSVLPKMRMLTVSDKSMVKAQILQLLKWKAKPSQ